MERVASSEAYGLTVGATTVPSLDDTFNSIFGSASRNFRDVLSPFSSTVSDSYCASVPVQEALDVNVKPPRSTENARDESRSTSGRTPRDVEPSSDHPSPHKLAVRCIEALAFGGVLTRNPTTPSRSIAAEPAIAAESARPARATVTVAWLRGLRHGPRTSCEASWHRYTTEGSTRRQRRRDSVRRCPQPLLP